MPRKLISIIVPVFNEEQSIEIFLEKVYGQIKNVSHDFEIIFIDDGSKDNTLRHLLEAQHKHSLIKVINLSRNFGKEAALTAGLDHANGNAVIPMDVDLQDPPELLPSMIMKWEEGYDIVLAQRKSRDKDTLLKRITAKIFYKIWNKISDIQIPENVGDFRLLDKKVIEIIKTLPEKNRFMKGIFAWAGFRTAIMTFDRAERSAGDSAWNYRKLCSFALDGILAFSTSPLKVWLYIGIITFILVLCWILKIFIRGADISDNELLIVVMLGISSFNLIGIGTVGQYLARVYTEVKARPIYVIRSIYDYQAQSPLTKKNNK